MKKGIKIFISVIIVLSMIAALSASLIYGVVASADEYSDKVQEANDIKNQINKKKNQVSDAKNDKKKIDDEISGLVSSINDLNSEISGLEGEIAKSEKNIQEISQKIDESDELLKARLRTMYEKGSMSYLDILFSSSDFSDLLVRIDVVSQLAKHDNALIAQLGEDKQKITDEKAAIETKKAGIESKRQSLAEQKSALAVKSAQSDALIADLNEDVESLQKEYDAKQKEANAILASIRAATANNTTQYYGGGKLGWPSTLRGTITSEFGMRIFRGVQNNHTGIDIAVPTGTPVLAAEDGVVLQSGWRNAYGNCVTINHGSITTLYAHNSKLVVSAGQSVSKGDVIAYAGSTGNSTGPHIHFGVIDNSTNKYLNPRPYIF